MYNEDFGNLYVYYDILLFSFLLVVEWLNYDIGEDKLMEMRIIKYYGVYIGF